MSAPSPQRLTTLIGLALGSGFLVGWLAFRTTSPGPSSPSMAASEVAEIMDGVWQRLFEAEAGTEARHPEAARGAALPVFVTVRSAKGELISCKYALAAERRTAALRAAAAVRSTPRFDALAPSDRSRCTLELNFAGPLEALPDATLKTFQRHVVLGRHGVVSRHREGLTALKETVPITKNWDHRRLRQKLAQKARLGVEELSETRLYRFTGEHWIRYPDGQIVRLADSHPVVPLRSVTPQTLVRRARQASRWLARQQLPSGALRYCYYPSSDSYAGDDNLVRQAGSLMAVAHAAHYFGTEELRQARQRGVAYFRSILRDEGDLIYVATPQGGALGATAFLLIALLVEPADLDERELALRLADSLMSRQTPEGGIRSYFENDSMGREQFYYPGETMLAIARLFSQRPSPSAERFLRRASRFYYSRWQESGSGSLAAWLIQALAVFDRASPDPDLRRKIYLMTDEIWAHQLSSRDGVPEHWDGANGTAGAIGPTFATATMSEALIAALATAVHAGDHDRAQRYRSILRRALRFVAQLQIEERSTYYMPRGDLALGGIRHAIADNRLRIDQAQHALLAWLLAAPLLEQPTEPSS